MPMILYPDGRLPYGRYSDLWETEQGKASPVCGTESSEHGMAPVELLTRKGAYISVLSSFGKRVLPQHVFSGHARGVENSTGIPRAGPSELPLGVDRNLRLDGISHAAFRRLVHELRDRGTHSSRASCCRAAQLMAILLCRGEALRPSGPSGPSLSESGSAPPGPARQLGAAASALPAPRRPAPPGACRGADVCGFGSPRGPGSFGFGSAGRGRRGQGAGSSGRSPPQLEDSETARPRPPRRPRRAPAARAARALHGPRARPGRLPFSSFFECGTPRRDQSSAGSAPPALEISDTARPWPMSPFSWLLRSTAADSVC